jgi:HK97 family phage prohead protease
MKLDEIRLKDHAQRVKAAEGDARSFEGYVSVFGNIDSYGEKVMPGAFANSLARHKREGTMPLLLWQHDSDEPIGVWDDLSDDGKGLFGIGHLLTGVQSADEAYIRLKAGAVWGLSIGYREVDVTPADGGEARLLNELDLIEASIVSFPANRRAAVDTVKAEGADAEPQNDGFALRGVHAQAARRRAAPRQGFRGSPARGRDPEGDGRADRLCRLFESHSERVRG